MKTQEPSRIGHVLPGILKKLGLDEKAANTILVPLWREAVGLNISMHTKPMGLQKGCLMVAVDTAVWKMELERYYKDKIVKKLALKDSRIKTLRFQIGQV